MIPRFYRLLRYTPSFELRPVAEISRAFPVQSSIENYSTDLHEELLSRQRGFDVSAVHPKKIVSELKEIENNSAYSKENIHPSTNDQNRILPFWEKNHLAHSILSSHWLVAYDGSPEADRLWMKAYYLAKIFKAKVSGLYIQNSSESAIDLPQGVEKVISNKIVKTILQYVNDEGVSLIWIGTHARKGKERVKHGSIAEVILKESTCPVWIHKENQNLEIQKILVTIDCMSKSHFVMEEALKLSHLFKAHLYFLHVSDAASENFSIPNLNLEAEWFHEKGEIAECIVKTAEKVSADLILMRTHSDKVETQMFPSGVSLEVLRNSTCSLLIVQ